MAWPTASISTGDMDAGTDNPSAARAAIKTLTDQHNDMRDWLAGPRVDVATHATSMNIGAANSGIQRWTGTATVTTLGTAYDVPMIVAYIDSTPKLQHGSALVCPGGVDLQLSAGDVIMAIPKATSGTADGWVIGLLYRARQRHHSRATGCTPRTTTGTFVGYTGSTTSGLSLNTSTGIWTCNRTGLYLVNLVQRTSSISGSSEGATRVKFNNVDARADVNWDWDSTAQSSSLDASMSALVSLTAGDTFWVTLDAVVATAGTPSVEIKAVSVIELLDT